MWWMSEWVGYGLDQVARHMQWTQTIFPSRYTFDWTFKVACIRKWLIHITPIIPITSHGLSWNCGPRRAAGGRLKTALSDTWNPKHDCQDKNRQSKIRCKFSMILMLALCSVWADRHIQCFEETATCLLACLKILKRPQTPQIPWTLHSSCLDDSFAQPVGSSSMTWS